MRRLSKVIIDNSHAMFEQNWVLFLTFLGDKFLKNAQIVSTFLLTGLSLVDIASKN